MEKDILIVIDRYDLQSERTIGKLTIKGVNVGFTIEDTIRKDNVKVYGKTAIPYGIYKLGLRNSPKFSDSYYYSEGYKKLISKQEFIKLKFKIDYTPHKMIWIQDVKNEFISFEFVLIHWGNTELDTEGCIIVGTKRINKEVLDSRIKYVAIYSSLYEQIKLEDKYIQIK